MKRIFSKLAILLCSTMLLAISCSNASQITFVNENRGNFTADGRAEVIFKVDSMNATRQAIFPDSWDTGDEKEDDKTKNSFFYEISYYPTGKAEQKKTNDTITWSKLKAGTASIELDPIEWDMYMTVYQGNGEGKKDSTKPILQSATQTVDLTTGSTVITFDLNVVEDFKKATGAVDINVNFFNKADFNIKKAVLKVTEKTSPGKNPTLPATVEETSFTSDSETKYTTLVMSEAGITPGTYNFEAIFYTQDSNNNFVEISKYQCTIYIDGGNTSRANIDLPIEAFSTKPAQVTDLKANVYFDPVVNETEVTMADKTLGQVLKSDSSGLPDGIETHYYIELTWKDNAFNEAGYELGFTDTDGNIKLLKTDTDNNNNVDISAAEGVSVVKGSLEPSSESITLQLNTGTFYKDFYIVAVNNLVKTDDEKNLLKTTIPLTENEALGMYTVAYKVQNEKGGSGYIQYSHGGSTLNPKPAKDYFVKAYNYKEVGADIPKQTPISAEKTGYPFIVATEGFLFGGWESKSDSPDVAYTTVEELENANQVLYAKWTREAEVRITFPNYDVYKNLKLITEQVPSENIIPSATGEVKISIPTNVGKATYTNPSFTIERIENSTDVIYGPGVSEDKTNGISFTAPTLTWDTTKFLDSAKGRGGIYRISISYDYSLDGTENSKKHIDGCVYVKLKK